MRVVFLAMSMVLYSVNLSYAGSPEVRDVKVKCDKERICNFSVTVWHEDEGWNHYANRWEVHSPEGEVLGVRILHHPHEDEQPFTRSLSGVKVPSGVDKVKVYAFDSVHGRSKDAFISKID